MSKHCVPINLRFMAKKSLLLVLYPFLLLLGWLMHWTGWYPRPLSLLFFISLGLFVRWLWNWQRIVSRADRMLAECTRGLDCWGLS